MTLSNYNMIYSIEFNVWLFRSQPPYIYMSQKHWRLNITINQIIWSCRHSWPNNIYSLEFNVWPSKRGYRISCLTRQKHRRVIWFWFTFRTGLPRQGESTDSIRSYSVPERCKLPWRLIVSHGRAYGIFIPPPHTLYRHSIHVAAGHSFFLRSFSIDLA
jgi:hypothetical protein